MPCLAFEKALRDVQARRDVRRVEILMAVLAPPIVGWLLLIRRDQEYDAALAQLQQVVEDALASGISSRSPEEILAKARETLGTARPE